MKQGHLSEFQIQQYLDGQQPDASETEAHLAGCSTCREALNAYNTVYDALSEAPEIQMTANLRNRVLAQIVPPRRFRFSISFETAFSLVFFLVSMITVGYLTGFSVNFDLITGFFAGLVQQLPTINIGFISDNILFIVVPLLIIIAIELLDKKFLKFKF